MSKYHIITLDKIPSTNSFGLENLSSYDDKTVIFTKNQTSGRGRFNRVWKGDESENLFMSIILKPLSSQSFPYANLTQYLSVVVCKCLENEFGLKPEIKWPNDILISGHKISGILAESNVQDNKIEGVVLGLGLNVNLKQETIDEIDQKATSLMVLKGKSFEVDEILNKVCELFFKDYEQFVAEGFAFIKNDYIERCGFLGKTIAIREFGETKKYFAKSIDDEGLLIATDEFSNECKIITGDILC